MTNGRKPSSLEQDLDRELDLPRGSRIARREARVGDHAERGAADRGDPSGLSKVRLVEQIERLHAELRARSTNEVEILDQRQIGVAEPRAVKRVPTQVAE